MEEPSLFGWYHILWILISLVFAWVLCKSYDRSSRKERHIFRAVFFTAVVVAVFELLKMINFNLVWENGALKADIQWYAFPFQFCSTPMYIGLMTGIFRRGKINDALCTYLASYAVFAGLCVMIYPGDVFIETVLINIQTMICHGSMISVGIYLVYTGRVRVKDFVKAVPVFLTCVVIALLFNEGAYRVGLIEAGHDFNMFMLSRYCEPALPVFSWVQHHVKYHWELMIYVSVFTLAGYAVLALQWALLNFAKGKKAKRSNTHRLHA